MAAPMPDFVQPDAAASSGRRRRSIGIAVVTAVALVAAALAIGLPALQRDAAEQLPRLVDDYVAAVEAGDAEAAAALHTPDGGGADLALLGVARPTIPAVLDCADPEVDGDVADVTCVVVAGGPADRSSQEGSMTIGLARDGDWEIVEGLERRASTFLAGGEVAAVGGVAIPGGSGVTGGPLLLPGFYDVDVATSPLVEVVGDAGMVVGPSGASLLVGRMPAAEVVEDAGAAALAAVEACVAAGGAAGECIAVRLAPGATLEASPVEAGPTVGWQGTAFVQPVLVGEAGAAPQVEVVVRVRFTPDLVSYELEIESASAVAP